MRVLLLGLIFLAFVAIGVVVYNYYKSRKIFFENLLSFCNHLKIEIEFSKNTLAQIIDRYLTSYSSHFAQVLAHYKSLLDTKQDITTQNIVMWKRLKPEEATAVTEFLVELGRHGVGEESHKLRANIVIFESHHKTAVEFMKTRASLYLKLCIILGLGVVIILI